MAPEVISVQKERGSGYSNPVLLFQHHQLLQLTSTYIKQADIWSLAITLMEFAEGKPPLFDIPPLRVKIHTSLNQVKKTFFFPLSR
jgi:serine/threonine protein kinase